MSSSVRSAEQRIRDVLELFDTQEDAWVASASADGKAHLVPLSFYWTGAVFIMALPGNSVTARNLRRAGWARIAIGPTRDVAIVEGPVEMPAPLDDDPIWDAHAESCGFDARQPAGFYSLISLTPDQIQTWRNPDELQDRQVMRAGSWVARIHDQRSA